MKISGIYITHKSIRLAQAVKKRGGWNIVKEEETDFASLKESKLAADYLVLGIPRTQVSIRYLTLPTVIDSEIKNMVEFELNNLFPYKADELIYDYAVVAKEQDKLSRLILAVAPREAIQQQIFHLKRAGLTPDAVSVSTVSLFNQFQAQNRPYGGYLLINFGDELMEMLFISKGKIEFSQAINFSPGQNLKGLIKDIELAVTVLKDKGNSLDKIILSGNEADLEGFAENLKQALGLEVEIDKGIDVLKGFSRSVNGGSLKINLLPLEFKIQKEKNKKRRLVYIFAVLLLINLSLIANIVFFGIKSRREYLGLLKSEIKKINLQASVLENKMLNLQMATGFINSGRLTLRVLSDVYASAPDGVNLGSLDIQSQKMPAAMVIAGQAKSAEIVYRFASALRETKTIKKADVSFVSQAAPSGGEQMVNFEIKSVF